MRLTREMQLGVVPPPAQVRPGPGDYEPPYPGAAANPYGVLQRRMPQFAETARDRFGNPNAGSSAPAVPKGTVEVPGPGAYLSEPTRETAVISGSVFMSGTSRCGASMHEVVPGPAYYTPAPTAKKSYHLNARMRWVPS